MKKISKGISLLLVLTMLITLVSFISMSSFADSANLLANPGFESAMTDNDWVNHHGCTEVTDAHSGTNSLLFPAKSTGVWQLPTLKSNTNYHVSAWMKVTNASDIVSLEVEKYADDQTLILSVPCSSTTWTQVSTDFTTGNLSAPINITLWYTTTIAPTDTAWADDVVLTEVVPSSSSSSTSSVASSSTSSVTSSSTSSVTSSSTSSTESFDESKSVNLALNMPVTADVNNFSLMTAFITDGDLSMNNYWSTGNSVSDSSQATVVQAAPGHWFYVDLGSEKQIAATHWYAPSDFATMDYDVQTSDDAINWTTQVHRVKTTVDWSDKTNGVQDVFPAVVTARYVRWLANWGYVSAREFMVFAPLGTTAVSSAINSSANTASAATSSKTPNANTGDYNPVFVFYMLMAVTGIIVIFARKRIFIK